ncbi:MAG: T9SS type A sorting domain-containing protein, partial [Bacteroidales bacterium]
ITERRDSLQLQLAGFGCYLDINDNSYSDFDMIIYPNPASDQIHVILARNDIPDKLSVALINYTGQLKYTETLMRQNEFNIDISGLPAGIYLLIINNETGRKIVIN